MARVPHLGSLKVREQRAARLNQFRPFFKSKRCKVSHPLCRKDTLGGLLELEMGSQRHGNRLDFRRNAYGGGQFGSFRQ